MAADRPRLQGVSYGFHHERQEQGGVPEKAGWSRDDDRNVAAAAQLSATISPPRRCDCSACSGGILPWRTPRFYPSLTAVNAIAPLAARRNLDSHAHARAGAALVDLPAGRLPRPSGGGARGLLAAPARPGAVRNPLLRGPYGRRLRTAIQRCTRALRHAAPDGDFHRRRRGGRSLRVLISGCGRGIGAAARTVLARLGDQIFLERPDGA